MDHPLIKLHADFIISDRMISLVGWVHMFLASEVSCVQIKHHATIIRGQFHTHAAHALEGYYPDLKPRAIPGSEEAKANAEEIVRLIGPETRELSMIQPEFHKGARGHNASPFMCII